MTSTHSVDKSVHSHHDSISNEENDDPVQHIKSQEFLSALFSGDIGEIQHEYSCSIEARHTMSVIQFGKLYITDKYLIFYGKILNREKKMQLAYSDIKSVEKEQRALAHIILSLKGVKVYCLKNFWGDRDHAYDSISAKLIEFSTDGSPIRDSRSFSSTGASDKHAPKSVDFEVKEGAETHTVEAEGDLLDVFLKESEKNKMKTLAVDDVLHNLSLDHFHATFLADGAVHSFKVFQESLHDTNVEIAPWISADETNAAILGRDIKFVKYVGLPGCSTTRGVKVQHLRKFGHEGLILYSSTRVFDVPSADTFTVDEMFAIQSIEDGKSIKVTLTCQVNFVKNTFFKGMIESNSISETKKWLQAYIQHVRKISSDGSSVKKQDPVLTTSSEPATPPVKPVTATVTATSAVVTTVTTTTSPTPPPTAAPSSSLQVLLQAVTIFFLFLIWVTLRSIDSKLSRNTV